MSPIIYTTRLPLSIAQRQPSKGSIFSSAPFGQSPEETLWIFKIDYDRQSARVTNGEHLLRQLAVCGAERTGGIEALVKYRFITGPSLVEVREPAKLSEHSASAVLHAPAWGAIWRWAPLQWGPSEWRAWHDHLSKPGSAWCSGVPLWTDCGSSWKSGSALAKTGRQWTIRACPESIHISRLGLMCL